MPCEDRGPDLLARALGQLSPDAVPEIETHLRSCDACRAESVRLDEAARSARAEPPRAPGALRARILAAVRDDAATRRAEAAASSSRACPALREDLPGFVLGQLEPAERERVAAHLASCEPCADEHAAADRLVRAQRSAVRDAVPVDLRARVLAAVRTEHLASAPPPPAPLHRLEERRARARARRISYLVPLVAAASILAALALGSPAVGLHVQDDVGAFLYPQGETGRRIDRASGEVYLRPGDAVAAGDHPVEVRLRFDGRRAAEGTDEPGAGEVRVRLQPGTQLVRVNGDVFELGSGRISVHAGPLDARLTIRHGPLWAAIVGTRFDAAAVGERLVVSVVEGTVEVGRTVGDGGADGRPGDGGAVGRRGDGTGDTSRRVGAGEDALVDGSRLLVRRSDATPAVDAFLAPRLSLAAPAARAARGAPVLLDAELTAGEGGPVTVTAFDDSDPRVLVRLKGPDGRTLEAKVQRSMLADVLPASPSVRLEEGRPYRLRVRLGGLDLAPGRWEASLRYQSYGTRPDGSEWHGTVESGPVGFEVTSE